jgi:hypothetical protein
MSTIKLENKLNAQSGTREMSKEEFIKSYTKVISDSKVFSKDVLELSEIQAKHPADVYIVQSFEEGKPCEQIRQGDIYLFRAGDGKTLDNVQYAKYFPTLRKQNESNSMALQFGNSITGDHRVVPLAGTKVKITECTIELPIPGFRGNTSPYDVKLVEADGPFCVVHSEHGNITTTAGTYLACTQIDARSLQRMRD